MADYGKVVFMCVALACVCAQPCLTSIATILDDSYITCTQQYAPQVDAVKLRISYQQLSQENDYSGFCNTKFVELNKSFEGEYSVGSPMTHYCVGHRISPNPQCYVVLPKEEAFKLVAYLSQLDDTTSFQQRGILSWQIDESGNATVSQLQTQTAGVLPTVSGTVLTHNGSSIMTGTVVTPSGNVLFQSPAAGSIISPNVMGMDKVLSSNVIVSQNGDVLRTLVSPNGDAMVSPYGDVMVGAGFRRVVSLNGDAMDSAYGDVMVGPSAGIRRVVSLNGNAMVSPYGDVMVGPSAGIRRVVSLNGDAMVSTNGVGMISPNGVAVQSLPIYTDSPVFGTQEIDTSRFLQSRLRGIQRRMVPLQQFYATKHSVQEQQTLQPNVCGGVWAVNYNIYWNHNISMPMKNNFLNKFRVQTGVPLCNVVHFRDSSSSLAVPVDQMLALEEFLSAHPGVIVMFTNDRGSKMVHGEGMDEAHMMDYDFQSAVSPAYATRMV